jgi:transcriptional antiterminator RfaH
MEWYVIQTKPKKEGEATSYLSTKGVEIFSPLIEAFSNKNGRTSKELKPFFPGYIFGKFDLMENFPLVRWGKGVKCVLGFGGYPVPLSEEAIQVIKERTDDRGVILMKQSYQANEVVRVKAGPLKDLIGLFERWVSDSERVRVLLSLIGYQPSIELHYSMIEKVA